MWGTSRLLHDDRRQRFASEYGIDLGTVHVSTVGRVRRVHDVRVWPGRSHVVCVFVSPRPQDEELVTDLMGQRGVGQSRALQEDDFGPYELDPGSGALDGADVVDVH